MKAFKEWKRTAMVDISNCKNGGDLMEVVMEETWRAATEKIKSIIKENMWDVDDAIVDAIYNYIKEELNEEG